MQGPLVSKTQNFILSLANLNTAAWPYPLSSMQQAKQPLENALLLRFVKQRLLRLNPNSLHSYTGFF